jgi:hypothetical protein
MPKRKTTKKRTAKNSSAGIERRLLPLLGKETDLQSNDVLLGRGGGVGKSCMIYHCVKVLIFSKCK